MMKRINFTKKAAFLSILTLPFFLNFATLDKAFCQEIQSEFISVCKNTIDPNNDSDNPIPCGYGNKIKGKTLNIPRNMYLWLVVHPTSSRGYWPQQSSIVPHPQKGTWQKEIWLGTRGSAREGFELLLILVNEKGNQTYIEYLDNASRTGDYPEISMPSGYQTVDMITLEKQNNDEF